MLTRTRTIITCTAAAAAASLAVSIAAPALASARLAPGTAAGRGGALRLTHNDHATGRSTARPVNTRTFAGYQATVPAGSATTVVASFTVPALSCTAANRAIVPDAGIAVRDFKSASVSFVFTGCVSGAAVYFPGLVVNGTETHFTASPFAAGDVIDLTTKVSVNRTRVQVTDVTTGVTQKIIGAGARARAAWVGDDAWFTSPTQLQHVPDFGKLTFKNCLIDGKALASWHPQAYQRVNSRGTVQISTGGFWPGGNTFTTRFEHS
jgi:Peptidase A4 family